MCSIKNTKHNSKTHIRHDHDMTWKMFVLIGGSRMNLGTL